MGKATAYIDPSYIPAVGNACNGIVTAAEFNRGTKGKEISDAFEKEYEVAMNGHSAEAYTAVWVLKTAIEEAGKADREAIKDASTNVKIEAPSRVEKRLFDHTIEFSNMDMNGQGTHKYKRRGKV